MAIIRAKREHNYTVINNKVFQRNQLSWQAMGMLSYLLSKPDDWSVVVNELINVTKDTAKPTGNNGVYNILKELKEKGFVQVCKNGDGTTDYIIFDTPNQANPNQANPNQAETTLVNTEYKQVLKDTNTPLPPNAENGKDDLNANAFVSANAKTCEQENEESTALKTKNDRNGKGGLSGKPKDGDIPRRRKSDDVPYQSIVDLYNETLGLRLPSVQMLTDTRKRAIANRWREMLGTVAPNGKVRFEDVETGLAWFGSFFKKVSINGFWMGENQTGFAVNFDWIFKPSNFVKILEWHPPKTN